MKQKILLLASASLMLVLLAACGSQGATGGAQGYQSSSVQQGTSTSPTAGTSGSMAGNDGELVLTLDELAKFNGKDGNPAYVAVDGVIYDVTDVPQWANGEHANGLTAGHDLTEQIKNQSPHGLSVLQNLPVVGHLA